MLSPIRVGTVPFDRAVDSKLLPAHLASYLRSVQASTVAIVENRVTFTAGLFRGVGSWNVLVPFGSGELAVHPDNCEVRYMLNCWQLIIVVTVMLVLGASFMVFAGGGRALWLLPFMWLWLVGGNLALGISRFRNYLVRAIADAPRKR
jgi:hypothetical protein